MPAPEFTAVQNDDERKGDSKNDRFLFSSLSVAYAIDIDKIEPGPQITTGMPAR